MICPGVCALPTPTGRCRVASEYCTGKNLGQRPTAASSRPVTLGRYEGRLRGYVDRQLHVSLPRYSSAFDTAVAVAVLAAAGAVPAAALGKMMFFAELGLDGRLRPVQGMLPAVAAAGFGAVVVAAHDAAGDAPSPASA